MSLRRSLLALIPALALTTSTCLRAQNNRKPETIANPRAEIYAGYSFFTGSLNHSSQPPVSNTVLNGFDAALNAEAYRGLSAEVEMFGEYGTNDSHPQHPTVLLAGPQYTHHLGRRTVFVHGLGGFTHLNSDAIGTGLASNYALALEAGGGMDTPLSPHVALRIEADMVHTHFNASDSQIQGLPSIFGKFTSGLVFTF